VQLESGETSEVVMSTGVGHATELAHTTGVVIYLHYKHV
jgi:hypothetical protein